MRLTEEGTKYFNEKAEMGRKQEFFDQIRGELSEAIPLNVSQLIINNEIKHDVNTLSKRILISITIIPPETNKIRNTKQILNDLDKMIKVRDGTPLMYKKTLTIYLDKAWGAKEQCK